MEITSNISTNKDQSERLKQCGVSEDTADMVWRKNYDPTTETGDSESEQLCAMSYDSAKILYGEAFITPAWSLSRLIALMPPAIQHGNTIYYLDFAPYPRKGWGFGYFNAEGVRSIKGLTPPCDPIEASVRLIEWLKGNGYNLNIKN
ncbi:MAG: hypothetical protein HDR88_10505 [Bacteroides sp.]|nr:hypothetical protein [Bacteroides sp.]